MVQDGASAMVDEELADPPSTHLLPSSAPTNYGEPHTVEKDDTYRRLPRSSVTFEILSTLFHCTTGIFDCINELHPIDRVIVVATLGFFSFAFLSAIFMYPPPHVKA
jgi:hypothetical protein